MAYTKHIWQNGQSGGTPINADRLNEIEDGIEAANETADDALGTANSASAVASDAAGTADEANAKSDVAVDAATRAKQTADGAVQRADEAKAAAATAHNAADAAQAAADAAQETADDAWTLAQWGGGGGTSPGVLKHAEASYTYAQIHGTPWNAGLVVEPAHTTDYDFVTFQGGDGKFTINESGVYAIDATIQSTAAIGGTLGIGNSNISTWYGISDVPSTANSWLVSISNLYVEAGTVLRFYYNCQQGANSAQKTGRVRISLLAAASDENSVPHHAEFRGVIGTAAAGDITTHLIKQAAPTGVDNSFADSSGANNSRITIRDAGYYAFSARIQSSATAMGDNAYIQIIDVNQPDPVIASTVPHPTSWWAMAERNSTYLPAGAVIELKFHVPTAKTFAANALKMFLNVSKVEHHRTSLPSGPRGLVAWSRRSGATGSSSENVAGGGSAKPFLRLDANLTPGRMYEVSTTAIRVGASTGLTYVQMNLGYANGPNVPATVYNRTIKTSHRWNNPTDGETGAPLRFILPVPLDADPRYSILVDVVAIGSGQAGLRPDAQQPLDIYVHDVGAIVPESSIHAGPGPDNNPAWNPVNTP